MLLVGFVVLSSFAGTALGQQEMRRLSNPATVRGFIGGESHDSYVIRVREGQTLTVQISLRRGHGGQGEERNGRINISVSEFPDFSREPVSFGDTTNNGKRWKGKIPKTADYYIYVTAHPAAHYSLRVAAS